ncbi:hypothetical protein BHYA_0201g00120 [Botrytis hyacinthi]|uniref:PHD-type domain-containing protein n=1 Tax=Botrytis hyacinthi TaxID=278943 RepID=A0A4Z1GE22_9HELO|nr:hypothetical protein BHYA_0201g00120 [Botrytis hyacinthi]
MSLARDPQNNPILENSESLGVAPILTQVPHAAHSSSGQDQQNHPHRTRESQTEVQNETNATLYDKPPAKRQMRARNPLHSSHTKNNLGAPKIHAQLSPTRIKPAKIFENKAEIREEITSATLAQKNAFLVEKKDYFTPLLPPNNYISKLITQTADLVEEEKAKLPTFVPYRQLTCQPEGIKVTLKPYQLSGLSYMVYLYRNGVNGILGDDMGLGKTLQTLSLIQYLKEKYPTSGKGRLQRPFLIICPLSVLGSWMTETEKWTDLRVIRFHGGRDERNRLKHIISGGADKLGNISPLADRKRKYKDHRDALGRDFVSLHSDKESDEDDDRGVDLVVTTYESFKSEQSWLKGVFVWRYVVLDEGQIIKNHASEVSKALQGLKAEYRLLLSGTPLQNNLEELWSLFHFLYPEVFVEKTRDLFANSFNLSKGDYIKDVLVSSRHLLELIMLRRAKSSPGVDLGLPPKEEILLFIPLSPLQKSWYEKMIKKTDTAILHELFDSNQTLTMNPLPSPGSTESSVAKKRATWKNLMNLVIQLRKVCNHPYQFEDAEPDPYFTGQHLIEASGKFVVLEKLVTELVVDQKKKVIIFSGFTKMLDLVQELLILKGGDGPIFNFCRIDGGTARARRNLAIRLFMDLKSNHNVFLISTRAGGLGLNLAAATEIILLDQDWNPQVTNQAIARAYRIGLLNPLTVYKFIAQGTIEEQMMPRIAKKLYLSAKVTESMEDIYTQATPPLGESQTEVSNGDDGGMPEMDTTQLMTLIRRGACAISRPEVDVDKMKDWDWETTVKMCKDQATDSLGKKDDAKDLDLDAEEAERKWLAEREHVQCRLFNGENIKDQRPRSNGTLKNFTPSTSRADRRIGKERTVMVNGYMVSKDTIGNSQWEAVKTLSSATASSSSTPKRERRADIISQSCCQVCKIDESPLIQCKVCPRAYHNDCLSHSHQEKAKKFQFACPQHICKDCKQQAGDVGGMLYRCRWCEKAQCEDCIDWKTFKPIGDTLPEFDLLGFTKAPTAFYIQCQGCTKKFETDKKFEAICERFEKKWAGELEKSNAVDEEIIEKSEMKVDREEDLEGGINRPIVIDDDDSEVREVTVSTDKVMKRPRNCGARDFIDYRDYMVPRNDATNLQEQATQQSERRVNLDEEVSRILNTPGQAIQTTGNTLAGTSGMRPMTDTELITTQFGYGRVNRQSTSNQPYFVSRHGSNSRSLGESAYSPRYSGHPDRRYRSPYESDEGVSGMQDFPGVAREAGHHGLVGQVEQPQNKVQHGTSASAQNIPRQVEQHQQQLQHTAAPSRSSASMYGAPRVTKQPAEPQYLVRHNGSFLKGTGGMYDDPTALEPPQPVTLHDVRRPGLSAHLTSLSGRRSQDWRINKRL